jgi:DNA-binding transcriptional LysR family regulator
MTFLDVKDLRSFLTIYKLKSITKAAQKLFITPQGLSKILKKLESELEVGLFTRSSMGVEPTYYGDKLAKKAEQIIEDLESIKNDVLYNDEKILLSIASTYGVMAYLTIDFLNDFRKSYPDIHLDIREYPDKPIEKLLWDEKVDLAFLAGPIDIIRFKATFFTSHKHCAVLHKSHRLAKKQTINYSDLNNEPIILMGREFKPFHSNMNRFLKAGVSPIIEMETSEIELTHQVANQNRAIGLSVDFPAFSNPYPNTVIKPFSDPNCTWETYIVFKEGREKKKAAQIFHDFSLKWIHENKNRLFNWKYDSLKHFQ